MQVNNPLVPPQIGQGSGAPALVANAPNVPDTTRAETARPVTPSRESERARTEHERRPPEDAPRQRGARLDLRV
ncbi:MAG: hypothetical protein ACE5DS_01195 [Kiloniellaceae bacterium]